MPKDKSNSSFVSESKEDIIIKKSSSFFHLVAFFVFGIANLLAWTGIVVSMPFFESVLKTNPTLQEYFSTCLTVCSMIPLLFGNFANMGFLYKFNRNYRVLIAKFISLFGFIIVAFTVGLKVTGPLFFSIMMTLAFIMNFCSPIMISGLYDDAGLIHFHCFSAINAGQAFAGVLTAVIGLILKAINLDSQITAILFFVTAMVFLSMSIIFYTIIINSAYYINKKATLTSVKQAHIPISFQLKKFYSIFKKKWTDSLTLFFTMSVTLMIYPVLMLSVTSTGVNKTWTSYFNSVHVFLIYNFFDFLGRYLPLILKFPKPGSIKLLILSLSRFGFIPLYFTCNRPNYKFMETLIFNDFVPILLSAIFGITNGHLITIIFGIPYSFKNPEDQSDCSKLFVLVLGLGLTFGAFVAIAVNLGQIPATL